MQCTSRPALLSGLQQFLFVARSTESSLSEGSEKASYSEQMIRTGVNERRRFVAADDNVRLLDTFADAPPLEWEFSGVLGGFLFSPPSATSPPGISALSFPDDTGGTDCLGENIRRAKAHVKVMWIGSFGVVSASGTEAAEDAPQCPMVSPRDVVV